MEAGLFCPFIQIPELKTPQLREEWLGGGGQASWALGAEGERKDPHLVKAVSGTVLCITVPQSLGQKCKLEMLYLQIKELRLRKAEICSHFSSSAGI